MVRRKKSHIRSAICIMIIAFLTFGYAYLTSSLSINGTTLLKNPTWDVHFENIQVKDGSVTGEQVIEEPEIDTLQTTVSFHIRLKEPGDYYEFTVDAVNAGTIDAMVNTFTDLELTSVQQAYLDASVTYEDGEEILQHQQLLAGDFAVFKVRVAYKQDLDPEDLPSSSEQLDLDFSVEFVQKDDTAIGRRAENSLYKVLKSENESGSGLALKYTGEHQDSPDASKSNKDIYYWYSNSSSNTSAIQNRWNVIFANHCWWMIRTTDTGGVKLIYNGETINGKCLSNRGSHVGYKPSETQTLSSDYYYGTSYSYDTTNNVFSLSGTITTGSINVGEYTCKSSSSSGTCSKLYLVNSLSSGNSYNVFPLDNESHYSQFGTLQFNALADSPAYAGYMYNSVYGYERRDIRNSERVLSTSSLNTSYWFADSYTYGSPVSNKFILNNPFQVTSSEDYPSLVGKYTFFKDDSSSTNYTIQYISNVNNSTAYYFPLYGDNFSFYNYKYTYGDSYIDNGNGTYTIVNPSTINKTEYYSNYSNLENKYVCLNATNNTCSDVWYVMSASNSIFSYEKSSSTYMYANDFEYKIDESDGTYKYFLNNGKVSFWESNKDENKELMKNAHYTCLNSSGKCTSLKYVFYFDSSYMYYVNLTGGKSIEDIKNEMFYVDDVNNIDSTIKFGIEAWFKNNMINYSNYLEDVIYCNDRSQSNPNSGGWYPNGGSIRSHLYFRGSSGLSCNNETDRFSVSNSKAKLLYPVGLMTYNEMNSLGYSYLQRSGKDYWLLSPLYFFGYFTATNNIVGSAGVLSSVPVSSHYGVRPVVSLKPSAFYSSGDGSMANPYVIDTN